jgi:hypothetical protein
MHELGEVGNGVGPEFENVLAHEIALAPFATDRGEPFRPVLRQA